MERSDMDSSEAPSPKGTAGEQDQMNADGADFFDEA